MLLWFLITFIAITLLLYAIYVVLIKSDHNPINANKKSKNICLLVAQPDDEVMFFGPTIRYLATYNDNKLYVLCMTAGDYYGKGELRKKEMLMSCSNLISNSKLKDVTIIDEPSLPDHPNKEWSQDLCTKIIGDYLNKHSIDVLVTFDQDGISGHANHCYLNEITRLLKNENDQLKKVDVFVLSTVNRIRKYMFLFDLIVALGHDVAFNRSGLFVVNSIGDFLITIRSMMKHNSQLVWFRWLYIFTSRYMFINNLEKM